MGALDTPHRPRQNRSTKVGVVTIAGFGLLLAAAALWAVLNPPRDVATIWLRQITDETGFQIIYVAALRSVGVPARLNSQGRAEFYDGTGWKAAPAPAIAGF